jgi:hypothetical protein
MMRNCLGVVLEYLEVVVAQAHLVADGFPNVVQLRVVAVGAKPADHRLVDEVVTAALDGATRRHRAVAPRGPCPGITRVPCRHGFRAANHLRVGAMVRPGR